MQAIGKIASSRWTARGLTRGPGLYAHLATDTTGRYGHDRTVRVREVVHLHRLANAPLSL